MNERTTTGVRVEAATETRRIAATLGRDARLTRKRRRWTQATVARKAGVSRARYAELERGEGATAPIDLWVRVGLAIDRPLAVSFTRDVEPVHPADAGHLAAQELVLRLIRATRPGRSPDFELPTRPADPSRSIDVCFRDVKNRAIVVVEIWNRLGDLGAAVRATSRKVAEADAIAVLAAGDGPSFRVASGWLLVDNAANRKLVARYPAIVRTRFAGSSVQWVRSIVDGSEPPTQPALAWVDLHASRLVPTRLRG